MFSRRKENEEDEILAQVNVIPLVDVSLVLLIIFIGTINHILTPSIKIKLPQSSHTKTLTDLKSVSISISSEGIIYLENEIVTLKELRDRIHKMHTMNAELGIVINVDKSTYFQRVVDALDILNELGVSKLDIRTTQN